MAAEVQSAIGVFGKLPIYPDFVRHNAGGRLARALDECFRDGLLAMRERLGAEWEAHFDAAAPFGFVYRNGNPAEALVGWCRPSRDQSGRRYPFSIFVPVSLSHPAQNFHSAWIRHAALFDAIDEEIGDLPSDAISADSVGRILGLGNLLPNNPVECQQRFDDYLNGAVMGSFWRDVLGDFSDPRKYLVIKNLFGALGPLRGQEVERLRFGIRLPVAADRDNAPLQTAIWSLICRAILGDSGMTGASLLWYDDLDRVRHGCYLFFQGLRPGYLPGIFVPDHRVDGLKIADAGSATDISGARAMLGDAIAGALDDSNLKLVDFIRSI